ncbi:alpha/beta fold hydrolase [Sphingobium baderi]|nr:alpha/beta fold hydrolase [Sphingobium baderi]
MVVWKGPQTTFFGNNVIAGAFNITKPILLLSSSLGTTMDMWEPQLAAFAEQFRVLRCDTRGHGGSDAPPGSYSLDRLGRDVVELLDALNIRRVHFCGLSLGGSVAKIVKLEHAWRRLDGRNDDGFQVAPFPG